MVMCYLITQLKSKRPNVDQAIDLAMRPFLQDWGELLSAETTWLKVQVASRFSPWLLVLVAGLGSLLKVTKYYFIPVFLAFEYTFWVVFNFYVTGEIERDYAYLSGYIAAGFILVWYGGKWAYALAGMYALVAINIIINILAYYTDGIFIAEAVYDAYFDITTICMLLMVIIGIGGAYGGGKRFKSRRGITPKRSYSSHWASVVYDLAIVVR